jgi:DNA-binding NarL/FixJ family response regulator
VRIHLQNIYARLQVSNRTAAVTRAFPDWGSST